jgi:hypothetical protein
MWIATILALLSLMMPQYVPTAFNKGAVAGGLTFIQSQNAYCSASGTTCPVTITTSSGNLLIALEGQRSGGSNNATPTDSAGNTWNSVTTEAGGTGELTMYYSFQNIGAVTSVTCNYSPTSSNGSCIVFEISGAATSAVTDGNVHSNAAANTSFTSAGLTTTHGADILITAAYFGSTVSAVTNNGSSFIVPTNGQNARGAMEYQIVSSTGTYTGTMAWTGSSTQEWIVAAFKSL